MHVHLRSFNIFINFDQSGLQYLCQFPTIQYYQFIQLVKIFLKIAQSSLLTNNVSFFALKCQKKQKA